ncbi:MAG: hypothetical protein FJX47_00105 [Alphaproteobacteria bacterium]|nr:hypothetical protein [Alphaproteobacteria bacterium]
MLDEPGSAAFLDVVRRLDAKAELHRGLAPRGGTFGDLMAAYRVSSEFTSLADRTRRGHRQVMDYLVSVDQLNLKELAFAQFAAWRDKTFGRRKRRFTNYMLTSGSSRTGCECPGRRDQARQLIDLAISEEIFKKYGLQFPWTQGAFWPDKRNETGSEWRDQLSDFALRSFQHQKRI